MMLEILPYYYLLIVYACNWPKKFIKFLSIHIVVINMHLTYLIYQMERAKVVQVI